MRYILFVCCCVQLCAGHARGQDNLPAPDAGAVSAKGYYNLFASHPIHGVVLIAEQGHIIVQQGFGHQVGDAFQLGSISKSFTALAVLQLAARRQISVQDPLVKYFPDFPFPGITIRHLLTHTSGLPDKEELFFPLIEKDSTRRFYNEDIIPALRGHQLAFAPGSNWRYNNVGYALLASLVARVSGMAFGQYLHRYVFTPAGMTHTYLLDSTRMVPGYLVRHHYLGDMESIYQSKKVRPWTYNLRWLQGPTNVVSTAQDLLKYDQALSTHRLLRADPCVPLTAAQPGEFGPAAYGYGWFIPVDTSAGKVAMHTGKEPGAFSFFWRDITHRRVVVLLDDYESPDFGDACRGSVNLLSGRPYFPEADHGRQSLFLPYVQKLYREGINTATVFFNEHRADTAHYIATEWELNALGLELLEDGHNAAATEALKLATLLYPGSWNTYDSYGKALLQSGDTANAVRMYEKSVTMFPGNEPAKKILAVLKSR
ncbi:hypothetical protein DCC81_10450 [Chitinophaga parva]|uniref:Beta-lactamase-related domain-containing protein n=1 Tax=Chitinophaga parva TaxID=2169414 RepID=A0A2T7BEU7_9BACT|nr:serine hydrolase domain-containing protein [Chitinophaga parva]PUZ24753.1 hypothetical protein DCC81_10450 [Chitinophaga parva]